LLQLHPFWKLNLVLSYDNLSLSQHDFPLGVLTDVRAIARGGAKSVSAPGVVLREIDEPPVDALDKLVVRHVYVFNQPCIALELERCFLVYPILTSILFLPANNTSFLLFSSPSYLAVTHFSFDRERDSRDFVGAVLTYICNADGGSFLAISYFILLLSSAGIDSPAIVRRRARRAYQAADNLSIHSLHEMSAHAPSLIRGGTVEFLRMRVVFVSKK
jgi:hypothetical protein